MVEFLHNNLFHWTKSLVSRRWRPDRSRNPVYLGMHFYFIQIRDHNWKESASVLKSGAQKRACSFKVLNKTALKYYFNVCVLCKKTSLRRKKKWERKLKTFTEEKNISRQQDILKRNGKNGSLQVYPSINYSCSTERSENDPAIFTSI